MEAERSASRGRPPLSKEASRYLTGVGLLLAVIVLWTASNFITAELETGRSNWNKPFLITYMNTASFALYLLPTVWRRYKGPIIPTKEDHERSYERLTQDDAVAPSSNRRSTSLTRLPPPPTTNPLLRADRPLGAHFEDTEPELVKLSVKETAWIAAWWSAVWFVANLSVTASLAWTSVASVTILSSTSGFFTMALGRMFGVEALTRTKVFAVIASFIGVILVTRSDSAISPIEQNDRKSSRILGDFAALLSASLYAVYVVLLKVQVGNEDRADMQLMLGLAGLYNIVCLLPIFPLLHYTGWETFKLPPTREAWTICVINMCITLSSDYLYMLAMLKTTPMLVTIGLSLTIPLALVGSLILPLTDTDTITFMSLTGGALVVTGFCMLGWQGWEESQMVAGRASGPSNEARHDHGDEDEGPVEHVAG